MLPAKDLLVNQIQSLGDKDWANRYFDLMMEAIKFPGLPSSDPRIVTSIVRGNAFLPISINNRYVLAALKDGSAAFIICDIRFENDIDLHDGVNFYFKHLPSERKSGEIPPIFVQLKADLAIAESLKFAPGGWKESISNEVFRAKASPYRKYHHPVVYRAAIDADYRAEILDLAFM